MALDLRVSWKAVRRKPSGKDCVELSNDRTACAVPLNRVALGAERRQITPWNGQSCSTRCHIGLLNRFSVPKTFLESVLTSFP
jgi:hypothetical protein